MIQRLQLVLKIYGLQRACSEQPLTEAKCGHHTPAETRSGICTLLPVSFHLWGSDTHPAAARTSGLCLLASCPSAECCPGPRDTRQLAVARNSKEVPHLQTVCSGGPPFPSAAAGTPFPQEPLPHKRPTHHPRGQGPADISLLDPECSFSEPPAGSRLSSQTLLLLLE